MAKPREKKRKTLTVGMSSSQARLLTLTARMHDIEYKAQRIEAQKLQLANDSRRAYEDYLVALDAKKIQYRSIASDGSVTFRDANLNILENGVIQDYEGEHAMNTLFIQNQEGKIMVTPTVADKFGLTESGIDMSMDDYIRSFGYSKSERRVKVGQHWESSGVISDITSIPNDVTAPGTITAIHNDVTAPVEGVTAASIHPTSLDGFVPAPNKVTTASNIANVDFNSLQSNPNVKDTSSMTNILDIDTSNIQSEYCIRDIEGLKKLSQLGLSGANAYRNVTFYLASDIGSLDFTGEDWNGISLPKYSVFDGNGVQIKNFGKNATVTSGLFSLVNDGATVKNVQLTNVNINANGDGPQAIGALANSCSTKSTIDNCLVTGNISGTNCSLGGIVGQISQTDVKIYNTNANVNITSTYSSNPSSYGVYSYGVGGVIGIDSNVSAGWTHCFNCNVTGTITQNSEHVYSGSNYSHDYSKDLRDNVGGVVGGAHQVYAPDTFIENCVVTVKLKDGVNGGAIGGTIMGGMCDVYTDPSSNQLIADNTHIQNVITDYSLNPGLDNTKHGNGSGNVVFDVNQSVVETPSLKEESSSSTSTYDSSDYYKSGMVLANLYAALVKKNGGDESSVDKDACLKYMKSLYLYSVAHSMGGTTANRGFEVANINQQLYNYLTGHDTTGGAFINALAADINGLAGNLSYTPTTFSDPAFFIYNPTDTFMVPKTTDATEMQEEQQAGEDVPAQPGEVKVPAKQNIADVLYNHLSKLGYSVNQSDVRNWINTKYNSSTAEGMKQLADLTDAINAGKFSDIYSKLSAGQAYIAPTSAYNTTDYNYSFKPSETITGDRGLVKIPTVQNIADMLYHNLKKAGKDVSQSAIRNWVSSNYDASTQEGMSRLADLNNAIQSNNIEAIYSKIMAGQPYTLSTPTYSTADYDFEFLPAQNVTATEGGSYVDDYKNEDYWDTVAHPEILGLMSAWQIGQKGIVIVDEEQASSVEFLKNMLEVGGAVLTTFDPNGAVRLQSLDASQITTLTDEQYDEMLGIKNTSVSVDTSVREVADEKELKKAEAKYEAAMRAIDKKDRKYDTDLAAIETERNATKQEMDTLKNVSKENTERTFKLFS